MWGWERKTTGGVGKGRDHTEQQVHPLHPEAAWPQVLQ
jgi:hypothetical protein